MCYFDGEVALVVVLVVGNKWGLVSKVMEAVVVAAAVQPWRWLVVFEEGAAVVVG